LAAFCSEVIEFRARGVRPYGYDSASNHLSARREQHHLVTAFISGLDLSRQFYQEAVRPVLDAAFPGMPHSAALLGRGSEVLGFDDEMSRDHNWEPRVLLFLRDEDHARDGDAIGETLRQELPPRFQDYPTDYSIFTLRDYFLEHLDVDIDGEVRAHDWLTFPEQQLGMITAGAVYHDEVGLQAVRDRFAILPARRVALLAGGRLVAHPSGSQPGRPSRLRGRRTRVGAHRIAAGARSDAAVLPDGKAVRTIFEVVRNGILPAVLRGRIIADPVDGSPGAEVARARTCS